MYTSVQSSLVFLPELYMSVCLHVCLSVLRKLSSRRRLRLRETNASDFNMDDEAELPEGWAKHYSKTWKVSFWVKHAKKIFPSNSWAYVLMWIYWCFSRSCLLVTFMHLAWIPRQNHYPYVLFCPSQKHYYFNSKTGKQTWEFPTGEGSQNEVYFSLYDYAHREIIKLHWAQNPS